MKNIGLYTCCWYHNNTCWDPQGSWASRYPWISRLDPTGVGSLGSREGYMDSSSSSLLLFLSIASMSMSIGDRLFGWFIVSAQTQPLIQAFEPFIHDRMTASCTKTYQRAGRRRQNGLIFYCCCSHTTYTTTDTGFNFHTGSHFFYRGRISAVRWYLDVMEPIHATIG